jgi:hypothetical protein
VKKNHIQIEFYQLRKLWNQSKDGFEFLFDFFTEKKKGYLAIWIEDVLNYMNKRGRVEIL